MKMGKEPDITTVVYHIGSFPATVEMLNYKLTADEVLKFFPLHELFGAHIQNKRAVRLPQQTMDFRHADVGVRRRLWDGQRYLLWNRNLFFHANYLP